MRPSFYRACIAFLIALVGGLGLTTVASAAQTPCPTGPVLNKAALTIEPMKSFALGVRPTIVVHLTTRTGQPIANQLVKVYLNDLRKTQAKTNSSGVAYLTLRYDLSAGKHPFEVIYNGSPDLGFACATASSEFIVESAEVAIRTVPPLPGIRFALDQRVFVTDESGVARIDVSQPGAHRLEVLTTSEALPDARFEFNRWNDEVYTPYREVRFPIKQPLEAGFIVSYPVYMDFVDRQGQLVDPARIDTLILKGNGRTYMFARPGDHWLPANYLSKRLGNLLEESKITYYIQSVILDGSNAINKGQQRFNVQPGEVWRIKLLMYSARFSARDALFGFPLGSGIRLEYPDGHTEIPAFGPNAELEVNALVRGSYRVTVVDAGGMATSTPLALSRDQSVELLVISYLDMVVVFGLLTAIALSIFFVGRPHLLAAFHSPAAFMALVRQTVRRELGRAS